MLDAAESWRIINGDEIIIVEIAQILDLLREARKCKQKMKKSTE